ncbi:phosphate/phosphite/phosphonate ABC transporter substrate-binding protein [Vibrio hannami]|uniref:phosphate/phosphite/phosphonate ABC transporter substrate-binding protein n=1 Tax=Vibrio hannami TaxID=2717094 RepID=UPI0024107507|nr:phosphate/phosphite/phosphonate ABC transporter substrate-binding protein [Vibrio hannami]MDG3089068.1 phosphate/phosphite/phosphonate ABC transporter substrate-binding protein [Vibrio hannami]
MMFRLASGIGISIMLLSSFVFANEGNAVNSPQREEIKHSRDTIVVGRVSANPRKHFKHLKPVADYLAHNLQDLGISKGEVLFAKDNEQMVRYIKQGKIDFITETIFSAVEFRQRAGAEVVLRRWKKGVPEYSSIIFTRKDNDIASFENLIGKTIAFQDQGSTTAFYVPASILIQNGYKLIQLDNPRDKPPADSIGYVFAKKEINISAWVHKGIVAAGALSNLDWDNDEDMPTNFRGDSRVIYESIPFPRSVELIRKDIDPAIKHRLVEILISAHEVDEGKEVLKAYQKTTRFDELSGSEESFRLVSELTSILSEQL